MGDGREVEIKSLNHVVIRSEEWLGYRNLNLGNPTNLSVTIIIKGHMYDVKWSIMGGLFIDKAIDYLVWLVNHNSGKTSYKEIEKRWVTDTL